MFSIDKIRQIAESRGMYLEWAPGYAEYEGYLEQPDNGIVFSDWNDRKQYHEETRTFETIDDTPSRMARILEYCGCDIKWLDEWAVCCDCGKAVRTSPDCYSWLPQYKIFNDCEIVCRECVLRDVEGYAETLEDNPDDADTLDVNWKECGYRRLDETYETGFHPGQNDDPHKVAEWLRGLGVSRFLFEITSQGQFDTNWCVWVHEDEVELIS